VVISEAEEARQQAHARLVGELQKIMGPTAVPVTQYGDPYATERLAQQVRDAVPPAPLPPSSEVRLLSRVNAMQQSVSQLVNTARGLGIKVGLPNVVSGTDPLAALQQLNKFHEDLERTVEYHRSTTKEQRRIDDLWRWNQRLEKRVDALASAMSAIADLMPHLITKPQDEVR
jgi:hypothetical protein